MENIIERLAAEIAKNVRPSVPFEVDLWDSQIVASYLKMDRDNFSRRIACLPDFPEAIRLPSETGGRGHPRWKAVDVVKWAERHKDSTPKMARPRKKH